MIEFEWIGELVEEVGPVGALIVAIALAIILWALGVNRVKKSEAKATEVINKLTLRFYDDLQKAQEHRDKLEGDIDGLQVQLTESDDRYEVAVRERDGLKLRIETLEKVIESQKQENETLVAQLRGELEVTKGELEVACASLRESEGERAKMRDEITQLQSRISELEKAMETITKMLDEERTARQQAELERDNANRSIAELKASIKAQVNEAVNAAIAPLKQLLAERDELIKELRAQLAVSNRATQEQGIPTVTADNASMVWEVGAGDTMIGIDANPTTSPVTKPAPSPEDKPDGKNND